MKRTVSFLLALLPVPVQAQIYSGNVSVVDGDTLMMTGYTFRLHGIDAPEAAQTCTRSGETWACGKDADAALRRLVDGKPVECEQRDLDVYRRVVAVCRVGKIDLGLAMIESGLAVSLSNAPPQYVDAEDRMKGLRIGMWGSTFEMPDAWRAKNQKPPARPQSVKRTPPAMARSVRPSGVYYRNCAAAWAAGAAPLYAGQPGYRVEMDGDRDGIACEPYRGRR